MSHAFTSAALTLEGEKPRSTHLGQQGLATLLLGQPGGGGLHTLPGPRGFSFH